MSVVRVTILRIVGRRLLIAVRIIGIVRHIRLVLVVRNVGIYEVSQIAIEMMKASMLDVVTPKVATGSSAVAVSEAFMANVSPAHVTAVESPTGAAAATSTKSTKAAATCGAHCFRAPSRRDEEESGERNDDEPTR